MPVVDTLDEQCLAAYLESPVVGFTEPLSAAKFSGGQFSNPTFKIDAFCGSYVLRRNNLENC